MMAETLVRRTQQKHGTFKSSRYEEMTMEEIAETLQCFRNRIKNHMATSLCLVRTYRIHHGMRVP